MLGCFISIFPNHTRGWWSQLTKSSFLRFVWDHQPETGAAKNARLFTIEWLQPHGKKVEPGIQSPKDPWMMGPPTMGPWKCRKDVILRKNQVVVYPQVHSSIWIDLRKNLLEIMALASLYNPVNSISMPNLWFYFTILHVLPFFTIFLPITFTPQMSGFPVNLPINPWLFVCRIHSSFLRPNPRGNRKAAGDLLQIHQKRM